MPLAPLTSTTLLRDLAGDAMHPRWGEFVARYRPMMVAYLREHFPSLEAEDLVQEVMALFVRLLPAYHYDPDANGRFRNYVIGVVRHKAIDALRRHESRERVAKEFAKLVPGADDCADERARAEWRETIYQAALSQFLADGSLSARNRDIFRRTAIDGESPAAVAYAFGVSRAAVDQAKSRMMARLREWVDAMRRLDEAALAV